MLTGTIGVESFDALTQQEWLQQAGVDHIASNGYPSLSQRVKHVAHSLGVSIVNEYPVLENDQNFSLLVNLAYKKFISARNAGITTVPIILGPVSFLAACQSKIGHDPVMLLHKLLPIYRNILHELGQEGCPWVQVHEPIFGNDFLSDYRQTAIKVAWQEMINTAKVFNMSLFLFGAKKGFNDNISLALSLQPHGIHFNCLENDLEFQQGIKYLRSGMLISLGLVDAEGIIDLNISQVLGRIRYVQDQISYCSLLLSPSSIVSAKKMDNEQADMSVLKRVVMQLGQIKACIS